MTQISDYIEDHIDPQPDYLLNLERASNIHLLNGRMCSGHLQGRLLKMLTAIAAPKRVLELGTFSGYSALCIAEGLPEGATIVTVEADDELENFIRDAFNSSPFAGRIQLHIGDAIEFCRQQPDESFDMVFLDADKRQYPDYYEEALRLLPPGGLILADNTLWDGHVADSKYANDHQTAGIMKFNNIVAADPRTEKVILPMRDGLTIIRKLNPQLPR